MPTASDFSLEDEFQLLGEVRQALGNLPGFGTRKSATTVVEEYSYPPLEPHRG